jgi:hypothetical protein
MRITNVSGTFRIIITLHRSKYTRANTFFGFSITRVGSTIVTIITSYNRINTSGARIAIGTMARVFIIALNVCIGTSLNGIASINGAETAIIAINQCVPASTHRIAAVGCTYVIVVTRYSVGFTTYFRITRVYFTCRTSITSDRRMVTSGNGTTIIIGTVIIVIAIDSFMFAS